MNIKKKYCIATVTDPEFFPGTSVLLHSFLKHNKWFDGDIVIINDSLPPELKKYLNCFNNVKFRKVSNAIKENLNNACGTYPALADWRGRFHSLEAFGLSGYEKVLYLDSDMMFLDNISELFSIKDRLVCCRDGCYYFDKVRDSETYLPVKYTEKGNTLPDTFNSGFMLIDGDMAAKGTHKELIALINKVNWGEVKTMKTADQIILNRYFKGKYVLVSQKYNFIRGLGKKIALKEKISLENAKVLHFAGKNKPWDLLNNINKISRDYYFLESLKIWNREYLDFLAQFHLRFKLMNR